MTDPTLSDLLANSEKLFKQVQKLSVENKIMRSALEEIVKVGYTGAEYVAREALEKVKKK
jgi:hypothetical protein